jgi:hypothetical protein
MISRSYRPRNLVVTLAALLALLASANLASASLSTAEKTTDSAQQVALADNPAQAEQATPAAAEQADQAQTDPKATEATENTETKKVDEPKQETHKVHVKTTHRSKVVCFQIGGLCRVLHVQPRPVFIRPVRFFRAW